MRKLALSDVCIVKAIKTKLFGLLHDPQSPDSLKIVGHPEYLRIRSGKYRIIYRYDDDWLYVVLIAKREIVYDEFSQLMK